MMAPLAARPELNAALRELNQLVKETTPRP
jgi:hypothetical protein